MADGAKINLELGICFNIEDQTFITLSFIFLKLLKEPNVIYLLTLNGGSINYLFSEKPE